MKTYRNLWPQICDFKNLHAAWRQARRGKNGKAQVIRFEADLEDNVVALEQELDSCSYQPGQYTNFFVHEAKLRKISAAPFPDRVVHNALCNVLEPIFERRFIHDSYACRRGKGTHRAMDRCTYFARRYPYVLKCDVAKFFPSVDHEILLGVLARTIRCDRTMELIRRILASGVGILDDQAPRVWFPGDDLFTVLRPKGLPIGNLTSQFWANVYLNELDQHVKRDLKVKGYLRYADDFLLFADRKDALWDLRTRVIRCLATLRLSPNPKSFQVQPVAAGIEFLGFRIYPDHRRLLPRNVRLARKRLRRLAGMYAARQIDAADVTRSVQAWLTHAAHGDTWGLRRSVLKEFRCSRKSDAGIANLHQDGPNADVAGPVHGEVPQITTLQDGQTN